MGYKISMKDKITGVRANLILNSNCDWVREVVVEINSKYQGVGSSPVGETKSIYESQKEGKVLKDINKYLKEKLCGHIFSQESFDKLIFTDRGKLTSGLVYSLSSAFFYARVKARRISPVRLLTNGGKVGQPKILLNVLNGGLHAYTNAVYSDFSEYLLVPVKNDIEQLIADYHKLYSLIKEKLRLCPKRVVGGNVVSYLGRSNDSVFDFLTDVLEREKCNKRYTIMVDASAGNFYKEGQYYLPVTKKKMNSEMMIKYWQKISLKYSVSILEDPLAETDMDSWQELYGNLVKSSIKVFLVGDNLFCSDVERLKINGRKKMINGTLIKPDQAVTVSRFREYWKEAKRQGLLTVASHRSVETESLLVSHLASALKIDFIKVGPLSNYNAVYKLNEIIRNKSDE